VDATNQKFITIALEQMKLVPHGCWKLFHAYDKMEDLDKQCKQFLYLQKKVSKETENNFFHHIKSLLYYLERQ
jgi:hypothetical protein